MMPSRHLPGRSQAGLLIYLPSLWSFEFQPNELPVVPPACLFATTSIPKINKRSFLNCLCLTSLPLPSPSFTWVTSQILQIPEALLDPSGISQLTQVLIEMSFVLQHWSSKCSPQSPGILRAFHQVHKVKVIFMIIWRCCLPFSLYWHLQRWHKSNGGQSCWCLRVNQVSGNELYPLVIVFFTHPFTHTQKKNNNKLVILKNVLV